MTLHHCTIALLRHSALKEFSVVRLPCLPSPFLRFVHWISLCVLTFTHSSMLMPDSFTPAVLLLMPDVCYSNAHRPAIRFDNKMPLWPSHPECHASLSQTRLTA
jgi:hypothetical protein